MTPTMRVQLLQGTNALIPSSHAFGCRAVSTAATSKKLQLSVDMSQRHSGISLALKMEVYCCGDTNIDSPIPQSGKHSA